MPCGCLIAPSAVLKHAKNGRGPPRDWPVPLLPHAQAETFCGPESGEERSALYRNGSGWDKAAKMREFSCPSAPLVLCVFSGHALLSYQVLWGYSLGREIYSADAQRHYFMRAVVAAWQWILFLMGLNPCEPWLRETTEGIEDTCTNPTTASTVGVSKPVDRQATETQKPFGPRVTQQAS